jgi:hypothetical protein
MLAFEEFKASGAEVDIRNPEPWLAGVILAQAGDGAVQGIRGAGCMWLASGSGAAGVGSQQVGVKDISHGRCGHIEDAPSSGSVTSYLAPRTSSAASVNTVPKSHGKHHVARRAAMRCVGHCGSSRRERASRMFLRRL